MVPHWIATGWGALCKLSHYHNLLGVVHCFCGTHCQGHRQNVFRSRWLSHVALPKAAQVPEFPTLAWWVTSHL